MSRVTPFFNSESCLLTVKHLWICRKNTPSFALSVSPHTLSIPFARLSLNTLIQWITLTPSNLVIGLKEKEWEEKLPTTRNCVPETTTDWGVSETKLGSLNASMYYTTMCTVTRKRTGRLNRSGASEVPLGVVLHLRAILIPDWRASLLHTS